MLIANNCSSVFAIGSWYSHDLYYEGMGKINPLRVHLVGTSEFEYFGWSPSTLFDPSQNPWVLTTTTVLTGDLMSAASSLCTLDYGRTSSWVSPFTLWCHHLSGALPEMLSKHPASLRLAPALISSMLWTKPCSRVPMCLTYNLPVWLWLSCAFLYICACSLPIWDDYRPAIGCHAHAPSDGPVNHHSILRRRCYCPQRRAGRLMSRRC